MADFTMKKKNDFTFVMEDEPEKVYTLPAVSNLGFEEAQMIANFGNESTITKQGKQVKEFILKHVPELETKGLQDMEYYEIIAAYIRFGEKGKLGES